VPAGKQRTFLFVAKGRYERLAGGRAVAEEPLPQFTPQLRPKLLGFKQEIQHFYFLDCLCPSIFYT